MMTYIPSSGVGGGGNIYTSAFASPPATPADGDWWLPSDGLGVVFARVSSAWVNHGELYPYTEPPSSGWTLDNQHTVTPVIDKGAITLVTTTIAGALTIYYRTAPTPPYTITACLRHNFILKGGTGATSTTAGVGICFRQASDGKLALLEVGDVPNGARNVSASKWTNSTTFSANYDSQRWSQHPIWFRIQDDNTNRILSLSDDGQNFDVFHSVGRTDFLTADQVGIMVRAQTTSGVIGRATLLSWKVT